MTLTFGPVPAGPPSLGASLLLIGVGAVGFASIIFNLVIRKRRDFHWARLAFVCIVLLFLTVLGILQLVKIW